MNPKDQAPNSDEPTYLTPEDLEALAMFTVIPCDWPPDTDDDEDEPQIKLPD
jgi:hypothetical protein